MTQELIKDHKKDEIEFNSNRELYLSFLTLFSSLSTLICCALPALFVTLGLGATLAGLTLQFPWLVSLSVHKDWFFSISFILLSSSSFLLYRARNAPCPIDPVKRRACQYGRKISISITAFSFVLWSIGAVLAYVPFYLIFN